MLSKSKVFSIRFLILFHQSCRSSYNPCICHSHYPNTRPALKTINFFNTKTILRLFSLLFRNCIFRIKNERVSHLFSHTVHSKYCFCGASRSSSLGLMININPVNRFIKLRNSEKSTYIGGNRIISARRNYSNTL